MQTDWRFQRTLFGHLALSILFFWYYVHNSFLRPAVKLETDCFLALLIIVAAEVNFWVLYPLFQSNKRSFLYFVLTATEIIILTAVEYFMTIAYKIKLIEIFGIKQSELIITFITNLLLRNCGLMSIVTILAYNNDLKIRIFDKDRRLFRLKRQLLVQSISDKSSYLLDADRICYVQQLQNYNRFFTPDGNKYERRSTLADLLQLLGKEDFLQVSKSVIVNKSCLKSCTEDEITLSTDENVENYRLKIGKPYRSEVIPIANAVLSKPKQENPVSEDPQPEPLTAKLNPKALAIFQYISTNAGCKITDIQGNTHLPKSTVTRYLKKLQEEGLVMYEGNKRTGGYFPKNYIFAPDFNDKVKY